jgi:hypothetical protein
LLFLIHSPFAVETPTAHPVNSRPNDATRVGADADVRPAGVVVEVVPERY